MTGPFNPYNANLRTPAAVVRVRATPAEVWTALASRPVWGEGSLDVLRKARGWGSVALDQAIDTLAGEGKVEREENAVGRTCVRVLRQPAAVAKAAPVLAPAAPVLVPVAQKAAEKVDATRNVAPALSPTASALSEVAEVAAFFGVDLAQAVAPAPKPRPRAASPALLGPADPVAFLSCHPRYRVSCRVYEAVLLGTDAARGEVRMRTRGESPEVRVLRACPKQITHLARHPAGGVAFRVSEATTGRLLEVVRPRHPLTGKSAALPRIPKGQAPKVCARNTATARETIARHRGALLGALVASPAGLLRRELVAITGIANGTIHGRLRPLLNEGAITRDPCGRYLLAEVTP